MAAGHDRHVLLFHLLPGCPLLQQQHTSSPQLLRSALCFFA
jgi:hypothetical protein